MHKNKKRKAIEERAQWKKQIFLSLGIVAVGIFAAKLAVDWLKTTPIMQPQYARPGEISLENGMPILIVYCVFLICMTVGGFLLERKMELESK